MGRPVILDCDTGTDDAVAIMLAALHPDLDLLGVTTVFGNLPVANTTDNSRRILDYIGRPDIGVYAGAAGPIAPRPVPPDDRRLPLTLPLPPLLPASCPSGLPELGHGVARVANPGPVGAADWIVETLRSASEQVTLVATGPCSNLATALSAAPEIADAIDRVVLMGGAHQVPGVTPLAERNVWNDPVAADQVLAARLDAVLITLDATTSAPLTGGDADVLDALGTPAAAAAAAFLRERIGQYAASSAPGAAPLHDPFTVAWLIDPSVVHLEPARLTVELADGPAYGRTVIDLAAEPNARVALSADRDALVQLLVATFT